MRKDAWQVGALYLETMAVTGALFTITNGLTERARPLTYGEQVPLDERMRKNALNSFYAGHTAATATATFFFAKVFYDYHPNSAANIAVWATAAAAPAAVGYLRLKAGKHFLSDNLIGYSVGALVGVGVPQLHKLYRSGGFSLAPVIGPGQGIAVTYRFSK